MNKSNVDVEPTVQKNLRSEIYILKHRLFKRRILNQYRQWIACERMSFDELAEYNFQRRLELLRFAYDHTVFYRRRFDECGLRPDDIKIPEDWDSIPVLTKADVRANFNEIRVTGVPDKYCKNSATGGSTGEPLRTLKDRRFPSYFFSWEIKRWWGISPGENGAVFGRVLERLTPFQQRVKSLLMYPTRNVYLDAGHIAERDMEKFVNEIREVKPLYFMGYLGTIAHFAEYCKKNNLRFDFLKAVSTTSAPLSATTRRLLEQAFEVPVYDQYGCCETNWIATQCREGKNLHIHTNINYVEFLNDKKEVVPSGEMGNVTITDLENRVFPLIRYQLGDRGRAVEERCPCGLPFPLMESIKGRSSDQILMPEGSVVAGEYMTTLFDDNPEAVKAFQIHQRKDYSIDLLVVVNQKYANAQREIEEVYGKMTRKFEPIEVRLVYSDVIPDDRGKTRFIISDLDQKQTKTNED